MPALRDLLADLTSGDSQRAEFAAQQLQHFEQTAIGELTKILNGQNVDARWWAARALAGFLQPAAGDLLALTLTDKDASVRQAAALALSARPNAAAIPQLIKSLQSEDILLARLAADALVTNGSASVEPLIAALEVEELNARVEAARALALIGDTRAVTALFKLLDSDSIVLQHWANEGLEKMGVGMSFFAPS